MATMEYRFSGIADLSLAIGNAQKQVADLKSDIRGAAGTLQADWSGSASASWSTVQHKWDSACDGLVTALTQLSATVQANGDAMSETESANAKMLSGG